MKYYLFIDECGDQNLGNYNPNFPIFTLCGILINETEYQKISDHLDRIKHKYWGNKQIVFHSRDIRKCQKGFEILFDLNLKQKFYENINDFVEHSDYQIIACSILKEKYIMKYGRTQDVYGISLSFIMESVILLIDDLSSDKDISSLEIETIAEKRGKEEDKELLTYYNMILDNGTFFIKPNRMKQYFKHFHFKWKRENECGLQLADLIAYPITRHALNPDEVNFPFDRLESKIYQKNNIKYGLKIFPDE